MKCYILRDAHKTFYGMYFSVFLGEEGLGGFYLQFGEEVGIGEVLDIFVRISHHLRLDILSSDIFFVPLQPTNL